MDSNKHPVTLSFDLVDGNSPLIVGMDIRRYLNTFNGNQPTTITFKITYYKFEHKLYKYISDDCGGNTRLRLYIETHKEATVKSLLASASGRREFTLSKRVNMFVNASPSYMEEILSSAHLYKVRLTYACAKVLSACEIRAETGSPPPTKKISTTHVNQGFT